MEKKFNLKSRISIPIKPGQSNLEIELEKLFDIYKYEVIKIREQPEFFHSSYDTICKKAIDNSIEIVGLFAYHLPRINTKIIEEEQETK